MQPFINKLIQQRKNFWLKKKKNIWIFFLKSNKNNLIKFYINNTK